MASLLAKQFWREFEAAGINIHQRKYGVDLDRSDHLKLHGNGWNREWKQFFDDNPIPIRGMIENQLTKMKGQEKYRNILARGCPVTRDYKGVRTSQARIDTLGGAIPGIPLLLWFPDNIGRVAWEAKTRIVVGVPK